MATVNLLALVALISGTILWWYLHVPWTIPRSLPRIPLYVTLLELWYDLGHPEVYERWIRKPMETHGAVVTWISGRWHVVIGRPELLVEVFKKYRIYDKAGNQVRIPKTVLGWFVGDNMINSATPNWELYSAVMKAGIQKPFDPGFFQKKARQLAHKFIQAQKSCPPGTGVPVTPLAQRFAVDGMAHAFYDLDLQTLEKPDLFEQTLTQLKPMMFGLLYRHLPFLDRFRFFLPSRRRAFKLVDRYQEIVYRMARTSGEGRLEKQDKVAARLLLEAYDEGRITRHQLCSNLKMISLAGHDTIQSLVACAMWELGSNTTTQARLRAEVIAASNGAMPIAEALASLPYLMSTALELLRLYPPLAQLPNRTTAGPVCLGDEISLEPNTWMGWNAYAAHTNSEYWGPTAREFLPGRWGETVPDIQANVRRQNVRGAYIPFITHTRKCAAQGYALMQIKLALFELVKGIEWTVDPAYRLKMNGGNLTFPVGLKVLVTARQHSE